jgi:hypothetical protein
MIKDVLLRFLIIMLSISTVMSTHLAWDIYSSSEAGLKHSMVYHADTNSLRLTIAFTVASWLILALVICETIRSVRKKRRLKAVAIEEYNYEHIRERPHDRPSIAESWKEGNIHMP